MKTLIIAEKPSVAKDLANALGKIKKNGDWYEDDKYVISSAVGHLVELFMPEDISKDLKFWRLGALPIIPEKFDLKPIEKTKSKFNELKKLLKRKDVDEVINACDAGREGELIFTYIYELSKCKKPAKRLWMQSMTGTGILDAFSNLKEADSMTPLKNAARCRSEADWLIGINGTRAMTTRIYGRARGNVATIGRVQTPTLTMVVDREKIIRNFVPKHYWRIIGDFSIDQGNYEGLYQRADFKKSDDSHDKIDRIWDEAVAKKIVDELNSANDATVTEEKKRTKQSPPRLYDLTSLQREANNRFGMPARMTLSVAQSLYEKHKAITYPRTNSKALPEDYIQTCKDVADSFEGELNHYGKAILSNNWIHPNKRIFNNAQISDHFAIIPTGTIGQKLNPQESKIFDMIARRFLAVFYPPAEFDVTTRLSIVGEHNFKTEGKVLVFPGWLEIYGKDGNDKDNLTPLSDKDGSPPKAKIADIQLNEDQTKPPPRYTEATLLSAMETAGKLVEEEELAEAMKESGLGTPATRAQIIERLIYERYMERDGRDLLPTAKADNVINFMTTVKVDALASPTLTGEWEHKLHLIEEGKMTREQFMAGIIDLTKTVVDRTKNFDEDKIEHRETKIISPTDGKPVLEGLRFYKSQDETLKIYKVIGNRRIEEDEISTLISDRKIGPLEGFRSKMGKPFIASLKLNDENKIEFIFENSGSNAAEKINLDEIKIDELNVIGKCPKCEENVVELPKIFYCLKSLKNREDCDFHISRTLLSKEIPNEQIEKLLKDKKTELIKGFMSKKTKRPFDAFLYLKKNGSIGFEFPPRVKKEKKAKPVKKEK